MLYLPALTDELPQPPQQWQQLPHGEWLQQQCNEQLSNILPRLFGYHLAAYGGLAAQLELSPCPIRHRILLNSQTPTQVLAQTQRWPFAEHSLDAIVAPFVLEYETDPHQVLREFSYSLIADGYLVLLGFNPWAPAVVPGWFGARRAQHPWKGRWFSRRRLFDWLSLLNFEVVECDYFAASLLLEQVSPTHRSIQWLHQKIPSVGAAYMLVARKREYPLTRVKQRQAKTKRVTQLHLANCEKPR